MFADMTRTLTFALVATPFLASLVQSAPEQLELAGVQQAGTGLGRDVRGEHFDVAGRPRRR